MVGLVMLGLVGAPGASSARDSSMRAMATVGAVAPSQRAVRRSHLLGTDSQGRDMLTIMVLATPQTLRIGLIAGVVGVAIGLVLGLLVAASSAGRSTPSIRVLSDSLMTVPGIAILRHHRDQRRAT